MNIQVTEKEKLGKYLIKLRKEISSEDYEKEYISQQELADSNLGLTKFFIGSVERGKGNPTLDKLIFMAKALKLEKIKLFDIEINVNKYIKELKDS